MTGNQRTKNDPHNPDQLSWSPWRATKALRYYHEKVQEVHREADAHIQEIQEWEAKEVLPLLKRIEHIEEDLGGYLKYLRRKDPKAVVSTPYARVSTRKSKKWEYDDDAIVKDGRYVKTEVKPDKAAIKSEYKPKKAGDAWIAVNADGEALDLVTITEEEKTIIKIIDKDHEEETDHDNQNDL